MGSPAQPDLNAGQTDRYDRLEAEFPAPSRVLSAILSRQAKKYGAKTLFRFQSIRWSYAQTETIAALWARRLSEAGVSAGERVAVFAGNCPEFMQIYLGCAWLGAITTPFNTALRGAQLAHVLNNSQPALLVVETALLDAFSGLPGKTPIPEQVWEIGDNGICLRGGRSLPALADNQTLAAGNVRPADTAAILYTSGTTGPSKGVCCPQAQFFWWGVYSARALGIVEHDVLMTPLPVFHTNALNTFYQALINGGEYVLLPGFSASRFWESARDCEATVTYLLGAMAAMLLAQDEKPADRAHQIRVALGAGVRAELHPQFENRYGVALVDGYGSTETNFVIASPVPSAHPGAMGYLSPIAEAMIVDDDDTPVADGIGGELLLRPTKPYAFASGYFAMPEVTVESWRNLWFHTGDRVVRQADGLYRFIDRMKDVIRRRGENISSWEVEQAVMSHCAIESCAVYPLPSELGEEEVAAAIQLKTGHKLQALELVQYLEKHLAYFAIPRYLRFVRKMPLTENGKIKKIVFREQGISADMWDREQSAYKPGSQ